MLSSYLGFSLEFDKNQILSWNQPDQQAIAMNILANISRSKSNQAMKFCQSIEYKMRNIFLQKSCKKCGWDTIPISFSKQLKLCIFLDQ